MANSFGLPLGTASRREAAEGPVRPPRPLGKLVWLHAPSRDAARPMAELGRRIILDEGFPVLLTTDAQVSSGGILIVQPPPADTQSAVAAFLDHWKPDAAFMSEGELRPTLIHEASARSIPLAMIDGVAPRVLPGRESWWPGQMRSLLSRFRHVFTVDEAAARAFRRAGSPPAITQVAGRLEEGSLALPCTEAERAALARLLATRQVWLAAGLPEAEEAAVIAAHHAALKLAHRLLLIIVPQDPERAGPLATILQEREGWKVARRSADEEPDAETEVFVADGAAELGLWYRLAPVTWLGGSLTAGCIRDPMEAASLGSAIVHGPRSGIHGVTLSRLVAARASMPVNSARGLAEALADLLAPDRVARLAHAGWAVASDGTEVTDRFVALAGRLVDRDP
ncbi:3-deoxy-D-manno-octulosonic acid transferase [Cereibacter sphaeroides]|uniref:3-deoxy-D-manno-octulosonic acid transferase n=1 Tax=Cereibacter sphaeroides TaxID=1063 RepID=UPI001F32FA41|nr:glycosyltransferase N-terminal domain-containing protein [Cereibacter sphaeroides]MCE6952455.1 3-deoxy-D-manno-octulosonic acid transferase [Cereibacter sphaeroides]MCE6968645.1 3-deoxy-D-manno-octulosonic acid transferase [Cereibacter sphaeroides]